MNASDSDPALSERELVLSRVIDATPETLFKAWTDPALLKQWFAPKPWTVSLARTDVRVGGSSLIVMRDPDGNEFPNKGVYLEIVPNQRLVFTDAFTEAWVPSEKAFMTVVVSFEPEGASTKYTARARHWSVEDRETHEKMGFYPGWGRCADQLSELVSKP